MTIIGGPPFLLAAVILAYLYYSGNNSSLYIHCAEAHSQFPVGRVYGQTSRDLRRLGTSRRDIHRVSAMLTSFSDSITRSPLYSMYGETIAGVPVIRAFGASSKFMRDMLRCVDTVGPLLPSLRWKTHFLPQNTTPYYWLCSGASPAPSCCWGDIL